MRTLDPAAAFRDRLPDVFRDRLRLTLTEAPRRRKGPFDLVFDLRVGGGRRRVYVETKRRLLRAYYPHMRQLAARVLKAEPDSLVLLAVPRLSERGRRELRQADVNHADLSGTVFIRARGMYVDVEGRETDSWDGTSPSINPFGDGASLVPRVMLEQPDRPWRVTDMSERAAVTKGWASQVAQELVSRGYVERYKRHLRLTAPVELLSDWSANYEWRQNRVSSYVAPFVYGDLIKKLKKLLDDRAWNAALTLLAGADLWAPHVQHEQVHVYVEPSASGHFMKRARDSLHLERTKSGGNFHIVEPFYRRSVFYGMELRRGIPVVSPVQLYLDLARYPLRGAEAAAMLARTTLARQLKLSAEQVRELE